MIDLKPFCSIDTTRKFLTTPCRIGDDVWATDGRIGVKVNEQLAGSLPVETNAEAIELFSRIIPLFEEAKTATIRWIRILSLPARPICEKCKGVKQEPNEVECEECDGWGEVTLENDFNTYECDCKSCDGDGTVMENCCSDCDGTGFKSGNKPVGCDFHAVRFDIALLQLIKDLPGLRIGIHEPKSLKAHYFTWDDGDGVLMPLRILGCEENAQIVEIKPEHFEDCAIAEAVAP